MNFLSNFVDKSIIDAFYIDKYLKYSYGCALLESPFFFIAHFISLLFNENLANSYSFVYKIFLYISSLFYFITALFLNYKILNKFISKRNSEIALLCIIFGTGLFNYSCFEPTMSHIYSYFAITLFLYLTIKFSARDLKPIHYFVLELNLGLITIIRNTNIIVFLVFLLYGVSNLSDFINNIEKLLNYKNFVLFLFGFFIMFFPQMLYWYDRTGYFLIDSYHPEKYIKDYPFINYNDKFYFSCPFILHSLFSIRKGLFTYYPVLFFSVFGIKYYTRYFSKLRYSLPVFLIIIIYIHSSFAEWHAGGSFGNRFYLDYMVFFSILIASFLENLYVKTDKKYYFIAIFILSILIGFTIFINSLYFNGFLDINGSFESAIIEYFNGRK